MEITSIGLANSITKSTLHNYVCRLAFRETMLPTDIEARFTESSQLIFPKE